MTFTVSLRSLPRKLILSNEFFYVLQGVLKWSMSFFRVLPGLTRISSYLDSQDSMGLRVKPAKTYKK